MSGLKIVLSEDFYFKIREYNEQQIEGWQKEKCTTMFGLPFEVKRDWKSEFQLLKDGEDITSEAVKMFEEQMRESVLALLDNMFETMSEGVRQEGKEPVGILNHSTYLPKA